MIQSDEIAHHFSDGQNLETPPAKKMKIPKKARLRAYALKPVIMLLSDCVSWCSVLVKVERLKRW